MEKYAFHNMRVFQAAEAETLDSEEQTVKCLLN